MSILLFSVATALGLYFKASTWKLCAFLIPLCILECWKRKRLMLFFALLMLLLLPLAENASSDMTYSSGFRKDDVIRMRAKAVSDGQRGKYALSYADVSVFEVENHSSSFASAKGIVRLSYPSSREIYAGDEVIAYGSFGEHGFSASSVSVLKHGRSYRLRKKAISLISSRIGSGIDGDKELMRMLLLGSRENPEYELVSYAQNSGMSYVLALSGMHLSLLSMLLGIALKPIFGKRGGKAVSLFLLLFYVVMTGFKPSLLRSLLLCVSSLFLRDLRGEEKLFIVLFLQTLLFPYSVTTLASLFSYLSLFGIMALSEEIENSLIPVPFLPLFAIKSFAASSSALVFTVPVTLIVFGKYHLSSLILSLPISLLIYAYMVLSIASLALPSLAFLRERLYVVIEKLFLLGSRSHGEETYSGYIVLLLALLSVQILSDILSNEHVGLKLRQHKGRRLMPSRRRACDEQETGAELPSEQASEGEDS